MPNERIRFPRWNVRYISHPDADGQHTGHYIVDTSTQIDEEVLAHTEPEEVRSGTATFDPATGQFTWTPASPFETEPESPQQAPTTHTRRVYVERGPYSSRYRLTEAQDRFYTQYFERYMPKPMVYKKYKITVTRKKINESG